MRHDLCKPKMTKHGVKADIEFYEPLRNSLGNKKRNNLSFPVAYAKDKRLFTMIRRVGNTC